jgi:hypothetical protein
MSLERIAGLRSILSVPGERPARFDKALASAADDEILDLEDAVAADAKSRARAPPPGYLPPCPAGSSHARPSDRFVTESRPEPVLDIHTIAWRQDSRVVLCLDLDRREPDAVA